MKLLGAAASVLIASVLAGCTEPVAVATAPSIQPSPVESQPGPIPEITQPQATPTFRLPPPTGGGGDSSGDVIVGGSVESGPAVTGVPAGSTDVPLEPSGEPGGVPGDTDSGDQLTITLADNDKTVTLRVGQTFLLKLNPDQGDLSWVVNIENQEVIGWVMTFAAIPDAQGMFVALAPGQTILTAVSELPCHKMQPPCMAPSFYFQVTIVVE